MTTTETPGAAIEGQVVLQAIEALAGAVERLDLERAEAIRERDEALTLLREICAWEELRRLEPDNEILDNLMDSIDDARAFLSRLPEGGEG